MARRRLFGTRLSPKVAKSLKDLESLSRRLEALVKDDSAAFQELVKAYRTHRRPAGARRRATRTLLEICRAAASGLEALRLLWPFTSPYLGADLKAGRALLKGAFEGAYVTAMMNFQKREQDPKARAMRGELTALRGRIRRL